MPLDPRGRWLKMNQSFGSVPEPRAGCPRSPRLSLAAQNSAPLYTSATAYQVSLMSQVSLRQETRTWVAQGQSSAGSPVPLSCPGLSRRRAALSHAGQALGSSCMHSLVSPAALL